MKRIGLWVLGALVVVSVFFEVTFRFELIWPGEAVVADEQREALFEQCYADRDEEIHRRAFGTIDNPDVQKEFITNNRARARAECRNEFPARTVQVTRPFRFNLVDLAPRYW